MSKFGDGLFPHFRIGGFEVYPAGFNLCVMARKAIAVQDSAILTRRGPQTTKRKQCGHRNSRETALNSHEFWTENLFAVEYT